MKDLLVFVATEFEDTELIAALDIFSRAKVSYDLISVENKIEVKGKVDAYVKTKPMYEVDLSSYKGVFLPGGPGHEILLESSEVKVTINDYYSANKVIAAICAAPEILFTLGILENKKYTSFPGFALSNRNTGSEVEIDGNIITGRDFKSTINFAERVVEELKK